MSSSGQTPVTQSQSSDPWSGAQSHLTDLYTRAGDLTGEVQGYNPYPGDLQAPLDPTLAQGLNQSYQIASQSPWGTEGVNAARSYGTSMEQLGGLTPDMANTANMMQNVYGQMGNTAAGYAQPYNSLASMYQEASGQQNPYLQAMLDTSNRRIGDRVNSSVSGAGRYGSGAHTDILARSLAEAADPVLAADYTQRQQTKLNALQGMQGALGGQAQALNAQQGVAGGIGNIYQNASDSAGKWAQLMPKLDEAQYAPAEQMQNYGNFYQTRSNQDLANQVAKWNQEQSKQWENLQRYAGILSGSGALGGTKTTTTTPAQASTLQKVLGGGLAGASAGSIFGAPGAAIGGVGGGLMGLL